MSEHDEPTTPRRPAFGNPSHESLSRRGRTGAFAAHSNRTPEERSAIARKAAEARWAAENKRRAELGIAPTKRTVPLLSAEELEPWLEEVDRRFPDTKWSSQEQRRRQALLLARRAAAAAIDDVLKRNGPTDG